MVNNGKITVVFLTNYAILKTGGIIIVKKKLINVINIDALEHYNINKIVVAIGVFDGVHCGHQKLIEKLLKMAQKHNATPVVMTFYPHPRAVLNSQKTPNLIISSEERKLNLLASYGVKTVVTVPFNEHFARLSPKEFIQDCLFSNNVKLAGLCVGSQWRFGAKGKGSTEDLKKFADDLHFEFKTQEEVYFNNTEISSSEVRRLIPNGELVLVAKLLGRPYELTGQVIKGFQIASTQLGFATANLALENSIIPPHGVYAARAVVVKNDGCSEYYPAAVNIGLAPTFNLLTDNKARVEAHLLGFENQDLYDQNLRLELLDYIREERTFADAEHLKQQIKLDIDKIIKIYNQLLK